jgi:fructan beta-fructosidase
MRRIILATSFTLVLMTSLLGEPAPRQDLLVADFEGETYGDWKAEGQAFGASPARGTLPNQMPVTGFLGKGLVNSYHGGDATTGTLTSPPFKIERKHLNFLIGGGGWAGQTCMNLLLEGNVVRTATGPNTQPGGSEVLEWASWDVAEFAGKQVTLQIVDKHTGGWGHINVDHIVQSDKPKQSGPARRELQITRRYLHLPVTTGAPKRRMNFNVDGKVVREFEIEYAEEKPAFWVFADVSDFQGKTLVVETRLTGEAAALDQIKQDDAVPDAANLYLEKQRPQFHFTSRRGWLNDPNGLVYHAGEWHLFYQHNPFGWTWGNMHWGHAVSRDLIHWQELGDAIYPPRFGDWAFSGSAVEDTHNTSGWGKDGQPPLVAAWTSTGRGECISFSTDAGRTWKEFEGNPVVKHRGRDPRLLWHAPTKQWVMAVYDEDGPRDAQGQARSIAFYTSPDFKKWQFQSRIDGYFECPDLFELPVDGDPSKSKWVLHAADGKYALGSFDGREFKPGGPNQQLWHGRFYAAQTYSNAPNGRRVQIGWANGVTFPGMPFNQQMTIPVELKLRTTPAGIRLHAQPVKELESLRRSHFLKSRNPDPREKQLMQVCGAPLEIYAEIELGQPERATAVGFKLQGTPIMWNVAKEELTCGNVTAPLKPVNGRLKLHIFRDRGSIEIFGNDGQVALSVGTAVLDSAQTLEFVAQGAPVRLVALDIFELSSAWKE